MNLSNGAGGATRLILAALFHSCFIAIRRRQPGIPSRRRRRTPRPSQHSSHAPNDPIQARASSMSVPGRTTRTPSPERKCRMLCAHQDARSCAEVAAARIGTSLASARPARAFKVSRGRALNLDGNCAGDFLEQRGDCGGRAASEQDRDPECDESHEARGGRTSGQGRHRPTREPNRIAVEKRRRSIPQPSTRSNANTRTRYVTDGDAGARTFEGSRVDGVIVPASAQAISCATAAPFASSASTRSCTRITVYGESLTR